MDFLTTLLSLSPGQQAETAIIFAAASTAAIELKPAAKANKRSLGTSAAANNSMGIGQIGAKANASFFQILTADQQETLTKFRS